jgi:ankyrin repeat protein
MYATLTDELQNAIMSGDEGETAGLLDSHPDWLTARTPNGVSAISLAMYHGHPGIAKLFIDRGAELDLFEAAAVGVLDRVRALSDANPDAVNGFSPDGFPPLSLAAFFGHPEIARFLIESGADVNAQARNPMQVRPIHAAAARNDTVLVKLLLDHGADPTATQQSGFTALDAAVQNGNTEMADLLRSRGAAA